jgi:hypothetical protein
MAAPVECTSVSTHQHLQAACHSDEPPADLEGSLLEVMVTDPDHSVGPEDTLEVTNPGPKGIGQGDKQSWPKA